MKTTYYSMRDKGFFYYHPNHLSSTMYVTDVQQSVVQSFLYAPYGEIISEYNTHVMGEAFPKYSFNAKELDEETGMYYYEARYYAPPVFTSRDPLFEKYFWITPYAYCANNPVKYVDPTGMDFDTIIKDNTITIKATYYTSKENEADLQKALDVWNNQSGQYSYVVGKGKDKQTYTINFDLTIKSFNTQDEADMAYANKSSIKELNLYKGKTSKDASAQGESSTSVIMINPNTVINITRSLAHEIGHTLGIGHYTGGLMESGGTSSTIVIEYIHEMISRFTIGPTTYSTWQSCPRSDFQRSEHEQSWKNKFVKVPMSGKIK